MIIKGSLLSSIPIVKRFQANFFLAKFWRFLEMNSDLILNLTFITPKGTFLRDFTSFELLSYRVWKSINSPDL